MRKVLFNFIVLFLYSSSGLSAGAQIDNELLNPNSALFSPEAARVARETFPDDLSEFWRTAGPEENFLEYVESIDLQQVTSEYRTDKRAQLLFTEKGYVAMCKEVVMGILGHYGALAEE